MMEDDCIVLANSFLALITKSDLNRLKGIIIKKVDKLYEEKMK